MHNQTARKSILVKKEVFLRKTDIFFIFLSISGQHAIAFFPLLNDNKHMD